VVVTSSKRMRAPKRIVMSLTEITMEECYSRRMRESANLGNTDPACHSL
jgi:hypothetical protein